MSPKTYVDNVASEGVDQSRVVRNNQDKDCNNISSSNKSHTTLNKDRTDDNHAVSKPYVVSLSETVEIDMISL